MGIETAISAKNVCKRFRLRVNRGRTVKAAILDALCFRQPRQAFAALEDVSFDVARGETLGIIGSNGAGKSTLLSLIAGTMTPTEGTILTKGTISSLLELGAGFHPDLTGRENVFLYGAIMGIPKDRMKERFEAVVEFAGLKEYIDQPVRHYSSGMYVRLGFAVAVEVDPDVLLIDEVLAVGDVDFQRKCLEKMREFRRREKTMLIVSHDLNTIQSVSDRILLLDGGHVKGIGRPENMVSTYRSLAGRREATGISREWGTGEVRITGADFLTPDHNRVAVFPWGGGLVVRIKYEAAHRIDNPVFGFGISDKAGNLIFGSNTQIEGLPISSIEGSGAIRLEFEYLPMATGTYLFSFSCHSANHDVNYHRLDHSFPISIESKKPFEGPCHIPCRWVRE